MATVPRSRGYARLVEACAKPGCPVCRCIRDDSLRYLGTLLYEHVTDPAVRASLRASRGFCRWHVAMLGDLPDSAFGSAIIAADVLAAEVARVEQALPALGRRRARAPWRGLLRGRGAPASRDRRPRTGCPACGAVRESERRHLDTMVESVGDPRFDRAFDRSDGPCLTHAERLIESGAPAPAVARLLARATERWRGLLDALRGFTAKHDHANRAPITEAEARSWQLALELLAGPPGDAGDAPARGGPARGRRA